MHHMNPDLTHAQHVIDGKPQGKLLVVRYMEVLGLWEGFLWELNQTILREFVPRASKEGANCYTVPHVAAIIKDGKRLVDAIDSYWGR